jgi:hypothetical protein
VGTRSVVVGGVLSLLLAVPHAFLGWPAIAEELAAARVDPDLVAAISVGWYFGSAAMLGLGVVVLLIARAVATDLRAFRAALVVGLTYATFGLAAILYRSAKPSFAAFVVTGAVIIGGAIRARKGGLTRRP